MRALLSVALLAAVATTRPTEAQNAPQAPAPDHVRPKYVVSYLLHLDAEPSSAGGWLQPWLTVALSESPTQPVNVQSFVVLRSAASGASDLTATPRSGAINYATAASSVVELLRDAALGGKPVYAYGRTVSVPGPRGRRRITLLQGVLVSTLPPQVTLHQLEPRRLDRPSKLKSRPQQPTGAQPAQPQQSTEAQPAQPQRPSKLLLRRPKLQKQPQQRPRPRG